MTEIGIHLRRLLPTLISWIVAFAATAPIWDKRAEESVWYLIAALLGMELLRRVLEDRMGREGPSPPRPAVTFLGALLIVALALILLGWRTMPVYLLMLWILPFAILLWMVGSLVSRIRDVSPH
jgi:uncharacterized membrane protein